MLIDEGLELLNEAQCQQLLGAGNIGRVGVTISGLPVIMPVNYAYVDGDVLFRTGEGTKLRAAAHRAIIAFEVDAYDITTRTGWSVLAIGRSEISDEPSARAELVAGNVGPWATGARDSIVRLRPEMLTGRRIVATGE